MSGPALLAGCWLISLVPLLLWYERGAGDLAGRYPLFLLLFSRRRRKDVDEADRPALARALPRMAVLFVYASAPIVALAVILLRVTFMGARLDAVQMGLELLFGVAFVGMNLAGLCSAMSNPGRRLLSKYPLHVRIGLRPSLVAADDLRVIRPMWTFFRIALGLAALALAFNELEAWYLDRWFDPLRRGSPTGEHTTEP